MLQRLTPTRKGGVEQYLSVRPVFKGYQTSTDGVVDGVYLDGISQTVSAVAAGSSVIRSDNPPAPAQTARNTYTPNSTVKPLVPFSRRYHRITGTAATDGAKFVLDRAINFKEALDAGGYVHFIASSPVTPSATAKIILRTSTGNEVAYNVNITGSAFDTYSFKLGTVEQGGEGATTGVVGYSSIKEIEVQVAGTINLAYIYATGEIQSRIGHILTWVPPCLDENPFENSSNRETIDIMCDGKVAEKKPKSKTYSFSLTTGADDLTIRAMLGSNVIKYRSDKVLKNIVEPATNSQGISEEATYTIGNGLQAETVMIDKTVLTRVEKISLLDANSFVQVGNLLTFSPEYANTGKESITILGYENMSGNTLELSGIKTSIYGTFQITKVNNGKTEIHTYYKVSIDNISETSGDQDKYKIDMTAYAVNDSWGYIKEL